MRSMTGFGLGTAPLGPGRLTVEVRALNHKHQEVRVRVPAELHEHSFYLEQAARETLGRGRFDVVVRTEGPLGGAPQFDVGRLRVLYASLVEIAHELDPDATVDIGQLLHLPEVVITSGPDVEEARSAIKTALQKAARELGAMQEAEGQSLKQDLSERLAHIRQLLDSVSAGATDLVQIRRQKLKERLEQLLVDSSPVSAERLEHEIAILADRSDITEELVRLQSHFDQFAGLLDDPQQVGRRLDFLLQEVGREVNTIGSKSPHTQVAQLVVEMKSEVERLREQVQNVA